MSGDRVLSADVDGSRRVSAGAGGWLSALVGMSAQERGRAAEHWRMEARQMALSSPRVRSVAEGVRVSLDASFQSFGVYGAAGQIVQDLKKPEEDEDEPVEKTTLSDIPSMWHMRCVKSGGRWSLSPEVCAFQHRGRPPMPEGLPDVSSQWHEWSDRRTCPRVHWVRADAPLSAVSEVAGRLRGYAWLDELVEAFGSFEDVVVAVFCGIRLLGGFHVLDRCSTEFHSGAEGVSLGIGTARRQVVQCRSWLDCLWSEHFETRSEALYVAVDRELEFGRADEDPEGFRELLEWRHEKDKRRLRGAA